MVRRPHSPHCRVVRFLLIPVLAAFGCAIGGVPAHAQSSPNVEAVGAAAFAAEAPSIEVAATVPAVIARAGDPAVATFTRTGGDRKKMFVYYSIKGTAKNGVDYGFINGRLKIKPNKDSAKLLVTPILANNGKGLKSVKITVRSNAAYSVGTNKEAVLYISYSG